MAYDWQMNYNPLTSEKNPILTLRRASDAAGRSNLFLEAHSTDSEKTFQAAEGNLTIEFPQKGFEPINAESQ